MAVLAVLAAAGGAALLKAGPSVPPDASSGPSPGASASFDGADTPGPSGSASAGASASASASASAGASADGRPRVAVPSTIDATCATDVGGALNAWIAGQREGTTLVFRDGACYLLAGDDGIDLTGRRDLVLDGTGCTLRAWTSGASNASSAFFLQDSRRIVIRGFSVDGGNEATGTPAAAQVVNERRNGAAVRAGSSEIEFDRVSWDRLFGFGVYLSTDGGTAWPTDISIHDSTIRGGEMGIAIVAGRRVEVLRTRILDSVYMAIDLEPDASAAGPSGQPGLGGGFQDVVIRDNEVDRYAWGGGVMTGWFVAAVPQDDVVGTAVMERLTIAGNRVGSGAALPDNGNHDGLGGLGIRADKSNRKTDFVIVDNVTTDDDTQPARRGVINLANVHNLTVTGNRQPITGGAELLRDLATSGARTVGRNDTARP